MGICKSFATVWIALYRRFYVHIKTHSFAINSVAIIGSWCSERLRSKLISPETVFEAKQRHGRSPLPFPPEHRRVAGEGDGGGWGRRWVPDKGNASCVISGSPDGAPAPPDWITVTTWVDTSTMSTTNSNLGHSFGREGPCRSPKKPLRGSLTFLPSPSLRPSVLG